ncbi:MAG: PhoH family protein [Bacteroidales bacterium]|nr:PhoH family protein [Bacteroidales bacterium]
MSRWIAVKKPSSCSARGISTFGPSAKPSMSGSWRGDLLQVEGSETAVAQTERVFQQLRGILRKNGRLLTEDVRNVIDIIKEGDSRGGPVSFGQSDSGKYLRPRTDGQARYAHALKNHDVVLCVGPAGTGKTYMAVAWAVTLLKSGAIKKLVLVRPAVEAGERLGYLPGDFMDKVNPYLRPLLDALTDMLEAEQVKRYMAHDIIEILPLAYMRGRTLNGACIILDEGQNATASQMKMFLTRMGHGSKIVVTGDMTQVDLPKTVKSGMADAVSRLKNIEGIAIVHLDQADIVRNPLVQRIVEAYDDETPRPRRPSGS